MDRRHEAEPTEETRRYALYVAMAVRNAMEDFHATHLSDAQMAELNPIIRNAICTALHATDTITSSQAARSFFEFTVQMIPASWEPPQLTESYRTLIELHRQG